MVLARLVMEAGSRDYFVEMVPARNPELLRVRAEMALQWRQRLVAGIYRRTPRRAYMYVCMYRKDL